MFINMTPHEINIYDQSNLVLTVPPSGAVARVDSVNLTRGWIEGVSVYTTTYGAVTVTINGKPSPFPEAMFQTYLIVSAMVRQALPTRGDLFSPGELVRNESGQPIGCQGLVVNG